MKNLEHIAEITVTEISTLSKEADVILDEVTKARLIGKFCALRVEDRLPEPYPESIRNMLEFGFSMVKAAKESDTTTARLAEAMAFIKKNSLLTEFRDSTNQKAEPRRKRSTPGAAFTPPSEAGSQASPPTQEKDALGESAVHFLVRIGRPLDEIVTADSYIKGCTPEREHLGIDAAVEQQMHLYRTGEVKDTSITEETPIAPVGYFLTKQVLPKGATVLVYDSFFADLTGVSLLHNPAANADAQSA